MLNMHPGTIGGYIIKIRNFCWYQFLRTNFGEDTILKIKCENIKKVWRGQETASAIGNSKQISSTTHLPDLLHFFSSLTKIL